MEEHKKIALTYDELEKIQIKLEGILLMTDDKEISNRVKEILGILESSLKSNDIPIKEIIHNKMKETKYVDDELNFKLYMLYRKLSDGKIDEAEAMKAYNLYVNEII